MCNSGMCIDMPCEGPYCMAVGRAPAPKYEEHHLPLTPDRYASAAFVWVNSPSRDGAQFDVELRAGDAGPVFQVFARDGMPFVRAGLSVRPLVAERTYQVLATVEDGATRVELVDAIDRTSVLTVRRDGVAPLALRTRADLPLQSLSAK
jgi:hypothetical protein